MITWRQTEDAPRVKYENARPGHHRRMRYSVVATTPNSQYADMGSLPGAYTGQTGREKLVAIADTVEDCECKCVRLYDGLNVACVAYGTITTCWFPAAVRRLLRS